MLDFRIQTFIAVWEERNYTRAAERLFLTQPAVSQHIKYLEEEFGGPLFHHKGKELRLTQGGELLYQWAVIASAEAERTRLRVKRAVQGVMITLRFGATRTIGEYIIPTVLKYYLRDNPERKVSYLVDNTRNLLIKLEKGDVDFVFLEGNFDSGRYKTELLLRDSFVAVCSPDVAMDPASVLLRDLTDQRFIVREKGSGSRTIIEGALDALGINLSSFSSVLEVGNIEAIKELVSSGIGISILYRQSVVSDLRSQRLKEISLKDFSLSHEYSFVTTKDSLYRKEYMEFLYYAQKILKKR